MMSTLRISHRASQGLVITAHLKNNKASIGPNHAHGIQGTKAFLHARLSCSHDIRGRSSEFHRQSAAIWILAKVKVQDMVVAGIAENTWNLQKKAGAVAIARVQRGSKINFKACVQAKRCEI